MLVAKAKISFFHCDVEKTVAGAHYLSNGSLLMTIMSEYFAKVGCHLKPDLFQVVIVGHVAKTPHPRTAVSEVRGFVKRGGACDLWSPA